MTALSINSGGDDQGRDAWRPTLMHGMWAVLILMVSWMATDAASARKEMSEQIASSVQRIATLEESNRNMRESLQRIESGINELRQQRERGAWNLRP